MSATAAQPRHVLSPPPLAVGLTLFLLLAVIGVVTAERSIAADPCPNAHLRVGPSAALPDCRAYELVSPAYKADGRGVGAYIVGEAAVIPGLPSRRGERYISSTFEGGLMIEGAHSYYNDYALSERGESGWQSKSPFTRKDHTDRQTLNQLIPEGLSEDFSLFQWRSNSFARLFAPMASWPLTNVMYASDWQGRWETIAPLRPEDADSELFTPGTTISRSIAADGDYMLIASKARGLSGPGDPALEQTSGTVALYYHDFSEGVSDTFPGEHAAVPLGVCSGVAGERTRLPSVVDGKLTGQICPDPTPGRDETPISQHGSSFGRGGVGGDRPNRVRNSISADGSRAFFLSPDPGASSSPAACAGAGTSTSCPPQLYVSEKRPDGSFETKWIARTEVEDQDASLQAGIFFEGASADGSTVFFRTNAPLTEDDPNGGSPVPGGIKTGTPSPESWDLYRYELGAGSGDGDLDQGTLTRLTGGPTGESDPNLAAPNGGGGSALRFLSKDGSRIYIATAGPIDGVTQSAGGSVTTPDGTPGNTSHINLYLYDHNRAEAERWTFIARLPRTPNGKGASCATVASQRGGMISPNVSGGFTGSSDCVDGTDDGTFITFYSTGTLTADDESDALDIFGFDLEQSSLVRISAPQGGPGGTYACHWSPSSVDHGLQCNADRGFLPAIDRFETVVTDPPVEGDRTVFFQSKSRLVADDVNSQMDIYRWRNGELALVSTGTSDQGAYLGGTDASGKNVFFLTYDVLTWEDIDGALDVYTARVGGGVASPAAGQVCDPLADECQERYVFDSPNLASIGSLSFGGNGNLRNDSGSRRPSVGVVRAKAISGSVARLRVRVPQAGRLWVSGSQLRRTGASAGRAGNYLVRVVLNPRARRALKVRGTLRVPARVQYRTNQGQTASRRIAVVFKHAKAQTRTSRKGGH